MGGERERLRRERGYPKKTEEKNGTNERMGRWVSRGEGL